MLRHPIAPKNSRLPRRKLAALTLATASLLTCASAQAAEPNPTSAALDCGSNLVAFVPAKCQVTVKDTALTSPSPPAGTVSFKVEGGGTFTPGTSCELAAVPETGERDSACTVTYEPAKKGVPSITASYPADEAHAEAQATITPSVEARPTTLAVSCGSGLVAFEPAKCQVTVKDTGSGTPSPPAGTVSLKSDSAGAFAPAASCGLAPVPATEERDSSCTVTYEPAQSGAPNVSATYPADEVHAEAQGSITPAVAARTTTLAVSCGSGVTVAQPSTCTATVTDTTVGTAHPPSGTVNFTSGTTGGAFTPAEASCNLTPQPSTAQASCAVQYTPGQIGSGTHTIAANYAGDAAHAIASGSSALTVSAAPVTTGAPPSTPPTTTPTTPPAAPAAVRPKCRVKARERAVLKALKRGAPKTRVLEIYVTYSCDQSAAVRVGGTVTIAASGHGRKRTKAQTLKLGSRPSKAVPGGSQPGVVLLLPARVASALSHRLKAVAAVEFTVSNTNGVGVATIRFSLAP